MYRRHLHVIAFLFSITLMLANCAKNNTPPNLPSPEPEEDNSSLRERYSAHPDKWPQANWYDGVLKKELSALTSNPHQDRPELLALGKVLFFDNRLGNRNNSCASCHIPENYWIDRVPVASGGGNRNTPNMENVWYLDGHLMLDGRATTFAEQITIAIESPHEMAGSVSEIPSRLASIKGYKPLFIDAFGDFKITESRVLEAIAAYSKSIISDKAPFDLFLEGQQAALTDQQIEGLHLFRTKAACINCHNGPFFTDLAYHNLGNSLDADRNPDNGRANFTGKYSDWGKFRTPGLRNVAFTAPYMHNGSIMTLENMIDLLIDGLPQLHGQRVSGTLSPHIKKLDMTYDERNALLAFIQSLSSAKPEVTKPILPN
ncbi:cytochrome-c peroxidase [Sphingobacterium faecale]|uniref:Cytochrome-c peroxidase n=1 Tax=Sphingobacterium faecale TaxID=2803775 RepID=A0ABS1QXW0_9SPHI|nr:cytochrome c peroxidase [Sphingobacterium faecale]MBL1407247.1 cytochrome-c peroxidase [Sphingobacterium faecale]